MSVRMSAPPDMRPPLLSILIPGGCLVLTDVEVRKLPPRDKIYRVTDTLFLSIEVKPSGFELWRFHYPHGGKANKASFGAYPEVCLRKARDMRDEARRPFRKSLPCAA